MFNFFVHVFICFCCYNCGFAGACGYKAVFIFVTDNSGREISVGYTSVHSDVVFYYNYLDLRIRRWCGIACTMN